MFNAIKKEIGCATGAVSPRFELSAARLVSLATATATNGEVLAGQAIRVKVPSALLDASRRAGGLRHRVGVLERDNVRFGIIVVHEGGHLAVVVFDPAEPEVRAMLADEAKEGRLLRMLLTAGGDARVAMVLDDDGFASLFRTTSSASPCAIDQLMSAVAALITDLQSGNIYAALADPQTKDISVHCVLTSAQVAAFEAERLGVLH